MNRNEFQKKAKQQIDELFVKIDELEAKSDKLSDKAKAEVDEKISGLSKKKHELEAKYEELKNASDDKWEEVKSTFSAASASFKEGLSKLGSLFS